MLDYIFNGRCPSPSYKNTIPDGEGWYRFNGAEWRKFISQKNGNYDGTAKYLTTDQLLRFAKDGISELT